MRATTWLAAGLVLFLTACASSGPNITVSASPDANLRQAQTWNFIQPLGTDRNSGARSPLSTMLMSSMSREMAARGWQQSDDPAILVDFYVTTQQRMDVRTTPTSSVSASMHRSHRVHRSHWRTGWYSTWPTYQTTIREYTEGTLLIDLIDPAANALVAEGAAVDRIRSNEFTQADADEVIGQIMSELLPR